MICFILSFLLTGSSFFSSVIQSAPNAQIGSSISLQYKVECPVGVEPEVELLLSRIENQQHFLPFNVLGVTKNITIAGDHKELCFTIDIQPLKEGKITYSPGFISFSSNDYLLLPSCEIVVEAPASAPLMQPLLLLHPEYALKLSTENRKLTFVDTALHEEKRGLALYELRIVSWEAITLALLLICSCLVIFWLLYVYGNSVQKKAFAEPSIDWRVEFTKLIEDRELGLSQRFDRLAYILYSSKMLEGKGDPILEQLLDEIRFAKRTPTEADWEFLSKRVVHIL